VADVLNQCERAGLVVQLAHGTVVTGHGYVLAVGDSRLGARWQARPRLPAPGDDDEELGVVITWRADEPPACDEHGALADAPLPGPDAAVVMLEHLRDVHGKNVAAALAKLAGRRDEAAT
jgi:hypothetical protein